MSGSGRAIFARSSSSSTASDGSPRFVFVALPTTPTMSPRSRSTGPARSAAHEELDLPGAVDEVEEDELPVPAPAHDATGEPPRLRLGLERLGLERIRLARERLGSIPDPRSGTPLGRARPP